MQADRLVIFDCDGTLVDSQHHIVSVMVDTFTQEGLTPPSAAEVRSIIGLSLVDAMAALMPDGDGRQHVHLAERYKSQFRAMTVSDDHTVEPLFPGTLEALAALDDSGYQLAIATGKSMRGLVRVLHSHGIHHYFISLQTADAHPSKPHPSMVQQALMDAGTDAGKAVVVGDTSYDMAMAQAAGSKALGVSWGYHPAGDLVAAGASHVADSYDIVPDLVAEILRG